MENLVNISFGTGSVVALLGYLVVFIGLVMLMLVVILLGKVMVARMNRAAAAEPAAAVPAAAAAPCAPAAPGTAGELKLYDTDPRDAAMVMAIVADTLGKPLNELRFLSIKEVK